MKRKIFSILLIVLVLILNINLLDNHNRSIFAQNEDAFSSAQACVVIEQHSNRPLISKNANLKLPMASTTKIMTAILAIENITNLDEKFIVDSKAIGIPGSSMYLKEGEEVCIKDLLYGLMLVSGNDAAMAIAYQVCQGNIEEFVNLMNLKAQELNCIDTHFDNPHGLDSKTHFTTAIDLAKITSYCMNNTIFKDIVKTKQIKVGNRYLKNKQKLLFMSDFCTGVKTGFTDNALRCSVSSFETENLNLICVVLNCPDMFEESLRLVNDVINKYKTYEILKPYTALESSKILKGKKDKVWAVNIEGLKYPLTQEEYNNLNIIINCENIIEAPIKNGQIIGKVHVYINKDLIFETNLCTIEEVNKENILDKANKIIQELF